MALGHLRHVQAQARAQATWRRHGAQRESGLVTRGCALCVRLAPAGARAGMKFGKRLLREQYDPWADAYVNYKVRHHRCPRSQFCTVGAPCLFYLQPPLLRLRTRAVSLYLRACVGVSPR